MFHLVKHITTKKQGQKPILGCKIQGLLSGTLVASTQVCSIKNRHDS